MRARTTVVVLIAVGILGAWVGYWLGHLAGWSRDAEWPFLIGSGDGAILLSIGVSFLSVMAALALLVGWPLLRERRLLREGLPGRATVLKVWRTGVSTGGLGGRRNLLGFDVEVHPDGHAAYVAHTTHLVSPTEETAFRPGVEVIVRYDPSRPTRVAIESPLTTSTA